MDRILHPFRTYRLRKEAKERAKIPVTIEHPRLKIQGKRYVYTEHPQGPLTYVAFLGIPYAFRPKGEQRFRPPQLIELSESPSQVPLTIKAYERESRNFRFHCFEYDSKRGIRLKEKRVGSENCLYLNIYLPERPENISKLLPVLVYIHGGAFIGGNNAPDQIKPDHIVRHNVIFVTVNYRLGLFGFLNMQIEECQGNAGLKDQVKALEWIQLNIEKFKGDPNNVTLSGHESGATCVNLHMISPLSRNLFHKAILQAGGIHCPWGFKEKQQYKYVEELCKEMYTYGYRRIFNVCTREAVVGAMQNTNAEQLLRDMKEMEIMYSNQQSSKLVVFFGPSEEFREEGAFLPKGHSIESLMEQAVERNIPVIAGFTKQEGYKYFHERLHWNERRFRRMLTEDIPFIIFLKENFNCSTKWAANKMDELRYNYFGESTRLAKSNYQILQDKLATFLTDVWFHRFYDNFKVEDKSFGPLYVYQFNYFDRYRKDGVKKRRDQNEELSISGICQTAPGHGDDNEYLYNPSRIELLRRHDGTLPATTNVITERMSRFWTSFCSDGVPKYGNVQWSPHTEDKPQYLSIDESMSMVTGRLGGDNWPILRNILQSVSPDSSPELSIETPLSATNESESTRILSPDSSSIPISPPPSDAILVILDD